MMQNISSNSLTLNNGVQIPWPGFGTYKAADGEICVDAVKAALNIGYKHIDTAAVYGNEVSVGRGIKESGKDRKGIFVTSKVWNTERGYDKTLRAFDKGKRKSVKVEIPDTISQCIDSGSYLVLKLPDILIVHALIMISVSISCSASVCQPKTFQDCSGAFRYKATTFIRITTCKLVHFFACMVNLRTYKEHSIFISDIYYLFA